MEYTHIMSRTMYCPDCYARSRPKKNDWFVTYGSTRDILLIKKSHYDGIKGFTPHLIMWNTQIGYINNTMHTVAVCGMHDCGVYIQDIYAEIESAIDFILTKPLPLTAPELKGLMDFKHSGYEIF